MTHKFIALLLALPRSTKRVLVLGIDAVQCAVTVWLALCLATASWVPLGTSGWLAVWLSLTLALPVFAVSGLYRAIFRYAGWDALMAVIKAVVLYGVLYAGVLALLTLPGVPRTMGLLQPILLLLAVGASRALARYWFSGLYLSQRKRDDMPRVLIYGAGSAGRQLAAAIASGIQMRAVGYLDDDEHLHGQVLNGLNIYNPRQLSTWVKQLDVSDVLLAIPSVSRQRRNEILELTLAAKVSVRTLPGLMDLAQGKVQVSDLRELDIEDLLGRDAVPPDRQVGPKQTAAGGAERVRALCRASGAAATGV